MTRSKGCQVHRTRTMGRGPDTLSLPLPTLLFAVLAIAPRAYAHPHNLSASQAASKCFAAQEQPKAVVDNEEPMPVRSVGKDGLTLNGAVGQDDPKVKVELSPDKTGLLPAKQFLVQLRAGKRYQITMTCTTVSKKLDSFLVIQSAKGDQLAWDDDSGGSVDSDLELLAPTDGTYRILASARTGAGPFVVKVRQLPGVGALSAKRRAELLAKSSDLKNVAANDRRGMRIAVESARTAFRIDKELFPEDDYSGGHPMLVKSLSHLADMLKADKQSAEAETRYRESLAMAKRVFEGDHMDTSLRQHNLGSFLQSTGRLAEAEPYFREAVAMRRRVFQIDHSGHANGMLNLALLLDELGKPTEAEPFCRDAVAMQRRIYRGDNPNLASGLHILGTVLWGCSRPIDAEPFLREAMEMRKRLFKSADRELASTMNNLAVCLKEQGKLFEAEPLLREALAMHKQLPVVDSPERVVCLNTLAGLLANMGRPAEAEPLDREALAIINRLGLDDKFLAASLTNLGNVLGDQRRYAESEATLRDALAANRRAHATDHLDTALALGNLAASLRKQGRLAEAATLYQEAHAMRMRLLKGDHPELAHGMRSLGILLSAQGKEGEAERYYRDSLAMFQRLDKGDHPDIARGMESVAENLVARRKYVEAESMFRKTLAMLRQIYPPDHPDVARVLYSMSRLHWLQRQFDRAEPLAREALAMHFRLGKKYAELRSEGYALNFLSERSMHTDGLLSISRDSNRDPAIVYQDVWAFKSALARVYERRMIAARSGAADPKVATLAEELAVNRRRYEELILSSSAARNGGRKDRDVQLEAIEERIAAIDSELRSRAPSVERSDRSSNAAPRDLQREMPGNIAAVDLLRYTYYGQKSEPCYLAFVVTRDKIARVELGDAGPIEEAVGRWREAIVGSAAKVPETISQAVRERVWQKIRDSLPAAIDTIYLSPDSTLTSLPWAALPGDRKGTILLEDYALAVIPHAPFLLDQLWNDKAAPRRPTGLLAVGGVAFDDVPALAVKPSVVASRDAPVSPGKALRWKYLVGAEAEAKGLQALAARKMDAVLLTGNKASVAAVLDALPRARFAHLATHGFFADKAFRSVLKVDPTLFEMRGQERVGKGALSPMVLSGLVFAGANLPDTPGRGLLTGESLIDRDLSGLDLAVLSACETGLGDVAGGEGVFGLQRAFHLAGARNVVASLWKVEDNATAALMAVFYREMWDKNQPPIEALRRAQLEIYRNPGKIAQLARSWRGGFEEVPGDAAVTAPATDNSGHAPPRQWAAFLLSGSGSLSNAVPDRRSP
jgi:CHAT domain-containing protein